MTNINKKEDKYNDKEIIVVTKYFGYNFTGATLTTHELVKKWRSKVEKITILTKNVGYYNIENINIIKCNSSIEIIKKLIEYRKNSNRKLIIYSDDHIGFIIRLAGLEYHHTYHANWPEARSVDLSHFIKSFGFIPMYKNTIKGAKSVIAVSHYSKKFLKKYNTRTTVIRNGIGIDTNVYEKSEKQYKTLYNDEELKIVMIGNIDKRKYILAEKLFQKLKTSDLKISVDIYGNNLDEELFLELSKYEFVSMKGFKKNIKIENYDLFISTSKMENLSISICEALEKHIPVISFDVGGLAEVIINGKNGFLIDEYNVDYFFKIIEFIKKERYKFEFKENILAEFNWTDSANRYLDEFEFRRL